MSQVRFIESNDDNWLEVKPDGGGENFSLPSGLKVSFTHRERGRDHFLVLEGVNKGKRANVRVKSPTTSHLVIGVAHLPPGLVTFDLKSQTLRIPLHGLINAFSGYGGIFTAVKPGTYRLAIPAFPSKQTRPQYSKWTRFHKSWFRIGLDVREDRFLHAGQISEGCVTVRAFDYDGRSGTAVPDDSLIYQDMQLDHCTVG